MTDRAIVALGERNAKSGALLMQGDIVDEIDAADVLERVLRGRTMLQIAEELGISHARVLTVYREALAAVAAQRAELGELVMQEHLQKVQKVLLAMEPHMEKGSTRAAESYLRALEQEARLLSLYPDQKKDAGQAQVNIQVNFNAMEPDEPDVIVGRRIDRD